MTYLEIINNVLRRLRQEEVTTYNENAYSTMVGDLVNDAMEEVQNAHKWSALFTEISVATADGTQNYTLDGLGEMGQLLDAINDTSNTRLRKVDTHYIFSRTNMTSNERGSPLFFAFNGTAVDRDPKIDLWPVPDGVYTLKFKVFKHQSVISDGDTEVLVPAQPVIQHAYALALRERGEVGGSNFNEQMALARSTLSNYIAKDAERFPELLMWDSGTRSHTLTRNEW